MCSPLAFALYFPDCFPYSTRELLCLLSVTHETFMWSFPTSEICTWYINDYSEIHLSRIKRWKKNIIYMRLQIRTCWGSESERSWWVNITLRGGCLTKSSSFAFRSWGKREMVRSRENRLGHNFIVSLLVSDKSYWIQINAGWGYLYDNWSLWFGGWRFRKYKK